MARQLGACCMAVLDASQNQLVGGGQCHRAKSSCCCSSRAACCGTERQLSSTPCVWPAAVMEAGRQEEDEELIKSVCMLCVCMQGDGFMSALSRSVLLRGSDMLTVLDVSENGIGDNGAAALAATLAAAGARSLTHIAKATAALRLRTPAVCWGFVLLCGLQLSVSWSQLNPQAGACWC